MEGRAAFAGERVGSGDESRRELAGGEGVEGAEAVGEFSVGEAALAVEPAEKIASRAIAFLIGNALQELFFPQRRSTYSLNSSRMRLTCERPTGISVCFLSFILSMKVELNQGTTSLM